jgi:hypothetical protein
MEEVFTSVAPGSVRQGHLEVREGRWTVVAATVNEE